MKVSFKSYWRRLGVDRQIRLRGGGVNEQNETRTTIGLNLGEDPRKTLLALPRRG